MPENLWERVRPNKEDPLINRKLYLDLLCDAITARAAARGHDDLDSISKLVSHIVNWLDKTDFFEAPASTKYHDVYPGGLVCHTLEVYNQTLDLLQLHKFHTVEVASAVFVALVHDWCKIGQYKRTMKNILDPETGEWTQKAAYLYIDDASGRLGHGPQSMVMVMQFCTAPYTALTRDEMCAIRWHSYTFDVTSYDIHALNDSCRNIPLVHLLQFADQLAITAY